MRRIVTVLAACALLVSASVETVGATGDGDAGTPTGSILGVVSAERGTLRLRGGSGVLALEGVPRRAVWFSDRPERAAGTYSIDKLVRVFFGDASPPNAALELVGGKTEHDVVVLELSKPRYDASDRSVRFAVDVIADPVQSLGPSSQLRSAAARADRSVPRAFGEASLFLDAADGDDALPCQDTVLDGYIPTLEGITCTDAQGVADFWPSIPECANQGTTLEVPNYGVWLCQGTPETYLQWLAGEFNFKYYDARFVMYPCSQNPPACQSSS